MPCAALGWEHMGKTKQGKKEGNRQINSKRVIVENALSDCKRLRIVKVVIRLHGDDYKELAFSTAVRIHNFRTVSRKTFCP